MKKTKWEKEFDEKFKELKFKKPTLGARHYISCKNKKGEYESFAVSEEVSVYVRQLEAYILYPGQSKLKEVYKDRFKDYKI